MSQVAGTSTPTAGHSIGSTTTLTDKEKKLRDEVREKVLRGSIKG